MPCFRCPQYVQSGLPQSRLISLGCSSRMENALQRFYLLLLNFLQEFQRAPFFNLFLLQFTRFFGFLSCSPDFFHFLSLLGCFQSPAF